MKLKGWLTFTGFVLMLLGLLSLILSVSGLKFSFMDWSRSGGSGVGFW